MTVAITGASSAFSHGKTSDGDFVENHVKRRQRRIAKAIRERKYGKAKALQWLLSRSYFAKLRAVRRVTQSKGSKTPGVDGVVWNSDKKKRNAVNSIRRRGYQPVPLKSVYIPKKKGKKRPLGIPCTSDKAQQALHLLGLEPLSETPADKNAYGFRPMRSVADAMEQCFNVFCRKSSAQWILEGDIKACFDKIGHHWLVNNIPMDKTILNKWLKSGYIDKGLFYRTDAGTPQGGIISPIRCVMTLHGLARVIKQAAPKKDQINILSYADDFVITGASKDVLENKVKPVVVKFLKERGLELSEEKAHITHIDPGFDFLGFNIRKYSNGKLIIKPAKQNVLKFVKDIKGIIKKQATMAAGELIRILNPKIRGWGNFYRRVVAKRTFSYVDSQIFEALYRWSQRRQPNKSTTWIVRKYVNNCGRVKWKFFDQTTMGEQKVNIDLSHMTSIPIKRHIKIKGDANPYHPDYDEYFKQRHKRGKSRNHWYNTPLTAL